MKNCGDLPMKNVTEIDRIMVADRYGWTAEEINSAAQAFKQMYRRQPASVLTFRQYLDLMKEQGLRPSMIGKAPSSYQLARYGDCGDYRLGNCRFIQALDNQLERAPFIYSDEHRRNISERAKARQRIQCAGCGSSFSPGMYSRWHGKACKASATATAA